MVHGTFCDNKTKKGRKYFSRSAPDFLGDAGVPRKGHDEQADDRERAVKGWQDAQRPPPQVPGVPQWQQRQTLQQGELLHDVWQIRRRLA
jgi:hypothetical protein